MKTPNLIIRGFHIGNRNDSSLLDGDYIRGLKALRTLFNREFNFLAFGQLPVTFGTYCRKMDEHIFAAITADEAIPLGSIEPLHSSNKTVGHSNFLDLNLKFTGARLPGAQEILDYHELILVSRMFFGANPLNLPLI